MDNVKKEEKEEKKNTVSEQNSKFSLAEKRKHF